MTDKEFVALLDEYNKIIFNRRMNDPKVRAEADALMARYTEESERRKAAAIVRPAPEGFTPVFHYKNGRFPYQHDEFVLGEGRGALHFNWDHLPTLPLRVRGGLHTVGWDIPTRYCIGADGDCWIDDSHGGCLSRVDPNALVTEAQAVDEEVAAYLRVMLDMKPVMPTWMKTALAAGWTPPADFNRGDYA